MIRTIRLVWIMSWDRFESYYLIAYPPETIVDSVISWGYDHIDCENFFHDPIDPSFGREKNIHLTILGNIEDTSHEKFKKIIGEEETIICKMGKIKLFKNNSKYDVVHIEVVNDSINILNKNLSQSIKNTNKFPLYIPHITIAYVKKGYGDKFLDDTYFEGQEFKIDELVLSLSLKEQSVYKLGKK